MDPMNVGAAVTAVRTAVEIFTGLTNLKVDAESLNRIHAAVAKAIEAQGAIVALQGQMLELQDENDKLRRAVDSDRDWREKAAGYALTRTAGGAMLYHAAGPPPHYACPRCHAQRQIMILQPSPGSALRCPECDTGYATEVRRPTSRPGSGGWI